jgi:hypothetical protein
VSGEVVALVALTKPTLPISDDLIDGLEALLKLARDGKIQGIAYATIQTAGVGSYTTVGTGWRGHLGGAHIALGGLATLQYRLLHEDPDLTRDASN